MSIQGTGTQTDPYIVDTIADFRTVCTEEGVYVKVTKDLNCNEEGYLEWETLMIGATDIDFDGHALIAVYVKSGNYFISYKGSISHHIRNGQILKLYEDGAKGVAYGTNSYELQFINMGIECYLARCSETAFKNWGFINCTVKITNNNTSNKTWIDYTRDGNIKNTDFILNGNININTTYKLITGSSSNKILGCRFKGKIKGTFGTALPIASCCLSNCVWNIDTTEYVSTTENLLYITSNAENSIYNKDIIGSYVHNNLDETTKLTSCTTEETLDPDHNNSIGFAVTEKEVTTS